MSLIALAIVTWIIYRYSVPFSKLIIVLFLFIIFHVPLLIFDLRHDFFIFKSLTAFVSKLNTEANISFSYASFLNVIGIFPQTLARIIYPTGYLQTSAQILPCDNLVSGRIDTIPIYILLIAIIIIGIFLVSIVFKRKRPIGDVIILTHICVALIGIIAYNLFLRGYLHEWILVVLLPAFCLMIAYVLNFLYEKKSIFRLLVFVFLGFFVFYNVKASLASSDDFGLSAKSKVVQIAIDKLDGKPFHLESIGSCYQTGFMYLFWYWGHFPTTSYADDMFSGTFYPRSYDRPTTTVVIATPPLLDKTNYWERYKYYKDRAKIFESINKIDLMILEE